MIAKNGDFGGEIIFSRDDMEITEGGDYAYYMDLTEIDLNKDMILNKGQYMKVVIPKQVGKKEFAILYRNRLKTLNTPERFFCEQYIANPVLNLNRSGYKTFRSCSGHVFKSSDDRWCCTKTFIQFSADDYIETDAIIESIISNHEKFNNIFYMWERVVQAESYVYTILMDELPILSLSKSRELSSKKGHCLVRDVSVDRYCNMVRSNNIVYNKDCYLSSYKTREEAENVVKLNCSTMDKFVKKMTLR